MKRSEKKFFPTSKDELLNSTFAEEKSNEEIYQEVKKELLREFEGWWDMSDAKEVAHGFIIKALYHYDIDEKAMLKLESRLINLCIDMGVK